MKKIIIAGGTGLIGQALEHELKALKYGVVIFSRKEGITKNNSPIYIYDDLILAREIENSDIVINLAGSSIAGKRWTDKYKKEIYDSRIGITNQLINIINKCANPPRRFISASAIGYYGDRKDELLTEESHKGKGFLADVCNDWEEVAMRTRAETKTVIIRIGVVLSNNGGALEKLMLPYKYYIGGMLGNGEQYISWISEKDLIHSIIHIIECPESFELYNLVNPNPIKMSTLSNEIAHFLRRPNFLTVPSFILKIILGEAANMILEGQNVYCKRLISEDFIFEDKNISEYFKKNIKR